MNLHRICLTGVLLVLAACAPVRTPPTPPAPSITHASAIPASAPAPVAAPASVSAPAVAPRPVAAVALAAPGAPAVAPAHVHPARRHPSPAAAPPVSTKRETPAVADTPDLRGRLTLVAARGQALVPGELVDSVVYYVPAAGAPAPRAGRFDIYTINRDFKPAALAVPLGSTVRFVNQDEVRHNVFSVTPGNTFDLGYQAPGQAAEQVLGHAGLVLVSCNVHRSMETDVLVVPSAYAAKVAADGRFVLRGLPSGPGKLYYWNPRGALGVLAVTLPASAEVAVRVEAVRPRVLTEIDVESTP